MNYGVKWSIYNHGRNQSLQALIGQTFTMHDDDELSDVMGYENHLSNYIGHIKLNYKWAMLAYRFRLNQRDFHARKNDLRLEVGSSPLRLGVSYLFQDAYRLGQQRFGEQKEVTFYGRTQLTKNFSLEGRYQYNLMRDRKGPLKSEAALRYDNECVTFDVSVSKSFTKDRNYKENTSINFRLYLKTLGGK